jgi:hypothetical protein
MEAMVKCGSKALREKPHDGSGMREIFLCTPFSGSDQAGRAAIEAVVLAVRGAVWGLNEHCFRFGRCERPKWEVDRLSSVRAGGGRVRNVYSDCSCRIRGAVFDDFHQLMLQGLGGMYLYKYCVAGEALHSHSLERAAED